MLKAVKEKKRNFLLLVLKEWNLFNSLYVIPEVEIGISILFTLITSNTKKPIFQINIKIDFKFTIKLQIVKFNIHSWKYSKSLNNSGIPDSDYNSNLYCSQKS